MITNQNSCEKSQQLNPITIRPPHRGDAAKLADLMTQLNYQASEHEMIERIEHLTLGISWVLVAEVEGNVVGCAAIDITHPFLLKHKIGRLTSMIIDSAYRGQGIGKFLLAKIEKIAEDNHCDYIELTSGVQREDAHRFYKSLGYIEFNDQTKYMSKKLKHMHRLS